MSKPVIKLYKATWCGHCNHFLPEWEKLCAEAKSMGIETVKYDADADKDDVEKANIKGFPSIMISVNGSEEEYNGPRETSAILSAVNKLKGSGSRPFLRGGGRGGSNPDYHKYRKYKGKYLHLRARLDRAGVSL